MPTRRNFLTGLASAAAATHLPAQTPPDHRLEIAPATFEYSRGKFLKTTAYNNQVPGPLLRLQEGRPVTVEIANHSQYPEVVHWHGLFLPGEVDGATEEGTPFIAPGATSRLTFTPRPAGFRWFHTHTMAMNDLTRAQYGGQHGFLLIEPRTNPAQYDQEFFLALHDWRGHLTGSDDGAMNPIYETSTINGKTLGFGEPLRIKQGQRVLLHLLNSSPTEVHWIALAGHTLQVIALDGNTVPHPQTVPMLRLAPAERACVLVQMNNPGVWVLGEVRKHIQAAGMGIVLEYAGQSGTPQWHQPEQLLWDYATFAAPAGQSAATPAITIPLAIESKFRGHGNMEGWTINGKSFPDISIEPLKQGTR